ncbi:unnamed protein product, partial [Allacma fusca]
QTLLYQVELNTSEDP